MANSLNKPFGRWSRGENFHRPMRKCVRWASKSEYETSILELVECYFVIIEVIWVVH